MLLENDRWAENWRGSYVKTFLLLSDGADVNLLNDKIAALLEAKDPINEGHSLFVQQYSSKYLHGHYENGRPAGGRVAYVQLFSVIAILILLIACINFMNLSTAQASKKAKEIGVKKAMGASRKALVGQFLGESMLIVFFSVAVAVVLVSLLLPTFNEFSGKQLHLHLNPEIILAVVAIALLTGLISGSYPAFYLAGLKPQAILKGKLKTLAGEAWARKGLVVFQFSLSVIFIIGLLVVNKQIELTQTKNLGYNKDNIVSFEWKGDLYDQWNGLQEGKSNERFFAFLQALDNVPGVVNTANMSGNILNKIWRQSGVSWSDNEEERDYSFMSPIVGYDLIETMGIELLAGRSFSKDYNDDYSKIILNNAAVKLMELQDPVGQVIQMNGQSEIIGVVSDFHYGSLHNKVEPLIFRFDPNGGNIMARIMAGTEKETLQRIAALHDEFLPGHTFEYAFLDEDYQRLYAAENKVSTLSKYFAALAIIISCLGLYGLSVFTAEQRIKEIGIRKVLGAGVFGIVKVLSADFARTVLAAILISLPISYFLAGWWLEGFAERIELEWWFFAGAGLLALGIAWAVVGWQTFRVARVNPVDCLKNE